MERNCRASANKESQETMTDQIKIDEHGRVRAIIFNRPERRNALTHAMYAATADAILSSEADGFRALLITGAGEAFTAGNDISDFAQGLPEGKPPVVRFLEAIRDCEIPIIAAVNGVAVGVGLTMLLHCDLAFASDTATMKAPFPHLGVVPEAGSSLLLPRAIGPAWANDVFMAGRVLTAQEALAVGLVSRVYPHADLAAAALEAAAEIARQAPNAMKRTKQLVRRGREELTARMEEEGALFAEQLQSAEFAEAAAAFLQKRKPNFG
jgi:enoyl-CoA hydratase/carnithine racemase